jgi:transitional endoplasmic reticulum ATPase
MSAAESILAATKSENSYVLQSFKVHTSASRTDTKSKLLDVIRNNYPDYHVTEVNERKVSLREYAASGKASLILDAEDSAFHATRDWKAVGEGIEKKTHPGALHDDYRFARFQYTWSDEEYLVYYATWHDAFKNPEAVFWILYPHASTTITASGNCPETDALILAAGKWTSELHNEIFVFDDGHWTKSKDLWKSVNSASWNDVILDPEMKKNLIEDVQGFFSNQSLYKEFAVPWKRGVILHGVPGNGKTVSIKALMSSLYSREDHAIPSLYIKSFETNCQTQQYAIRAIFTKARSMAPCLLIFEDLDSIVNDNIRSYFLNEVDGLESNDGILMIGSTNHLDKLDPAISKRPSRFDRKYHFKLPGTEERRGYAEYWRTKLLKNETVEFPEDVTGIIAQLTEGFSFAYMKELFVMALLSLARGFKGDDFEIVEKDEAESADGQEADGTPASTTTGTKQETCTCATHCAKCDKPLPASASSSEAAKKTDEANEADKEAKMNKMVMPTVEVPEHLQENVLLRVVKHQIRILHAEMDNSKEEEGKKKEKGNEGVMNKVMGGRPAIRGVRRAC